MPFFERLLQFLKPSPSPPQSAYEITPELLPFLEQLAAGEQRSLTSMIEEILHVGISERVIAVENLRRWEALTPREQQIAALTCLGYTNQGIAEQMVISANTVRTHMRNILHKFNINSKVELQKILAGWDFRAWVADQDLRPYLSPPPISASPDEIKP